MRINLIEYVDKLYVELKSRGIKFNKYGYPIFPSKYLLNEIPSEILPYHHRNAAKNKKKTIICFYEEDEELYRYLSSLESVAEECTKYMGIVGFDLSPCIYWNIQQQKFNLLLSQLVTLYIATKGSKIVPNYRIGSLETLPVLLSYPKGSQFCVGSLGCSRKISTYNFTQFEIKVFYARPKRLLYYGKTLQPYKNFLDDIGIPYSFFTDFRTQSYAKTGEKGK